MFEIYFDKAGLFMPFDHEKHIISVFSVKCSVEKANFRFFLSYINNGIV